MSNRADLSDDGHEKKKDAVTAISLDSKWQYLYLTSSNAFSSRFSAPDYNDDDWQTINLPHHDEKIKPSHKYTSMSVAHCYRKRFQLHEKCDDDQPVYLHFEAIPSHDADANDHVEIKIPAVTVWLNEQEIFSSTLPEPIDLTNHLRKTEENILLIYSKQGYPLRLHARIVLPRPLSGQLDFDDVQKDDKKTRGGQTLDYSAGFNDADGLIKIFIREVRKKYKEDYQPEEKPAADDEQASGKATVVDKEIVEVKTIINGPIPRLAIVMLIVGTRGDVQPFIALAKALVTCGHRVRLATHETFRKFVRENGIEFYPLAGDPADLMSFMVKNAGIVPSVSSIVAGDVAKSRRVMAEILASTWKACIEDDDETGTPFVAEAIIANPPSYGHIHCAQKLQIPLHIVFTMPWSPTVQFPHPLCKVDYNRSPIDRINMLSYDLVEVLTWSGMRNIINDFRKDTLGLPILHMRQAVRLMIDEHVPHTYCWSPSLVPKPKDWGSYINVSGFFFLDLASNYKPPDDIVKFLNSGEPPIYIGFGSITGHDSERILQAVLEALKKTGYRGLLSGFDAKNDELPSNVLKIGNCPHDWLFQNVAAVCHHGGAGTTAAGLKAGKPTIIVPFFGDQFFWGSMISKSGAGPVPMPGKTVTAQQFADAFKFVHEPKTREAAMKISVNFQGEKGCEAAIQSFHAHLPLTKMRSDLEPSFGACFRLSDYELQISRPVAQVLVAAGAVAESELAPHPTYGWYSLMQGDRFEAFKRGIRNVFSKISNAVHHSTNTHNSNVKENSNGLADFEHGSIEKPFKQRLSLYGVVKEQPADERKDNAANQVKHTVRYGLAGLVMKPSVSSHRQSVAAAGSSPAVDSPQKNVASTGAKPTANGAAASKSRPAPSTNVKTRSISNGRTKVPTQAKDKTVARSPEEKAAEASGYTVEVCKRILADFQTIKNERNPSNENEKPKHRLRIPHALHRTHNQPVVAPN